VNGDIREGSYSSAMGPRATSNFSMSGTYDIDFDSSIKVVGKDRKGKDVKFTKPIYVEDQEYPTQMIVIAEEGENHVYVWKDWPPTTPDIDPATFTDEANQTTEDQIDLDKGQRRDVQRRLSGLGFDVKVTGKFDDDTRAVIRRWQNTRGYPTTGYLNKLQHKALLSEIVAKSGAAQQYHKEKGPCACPEDKDEAGNKCGRHSAFCESDGKGIENCYLKDVERQKKKECWFVYDPARLPQLPMQRTPPLSPRQ
jgi:peptidoglycan hydrolase-like protein with peptidoglycan-binding domain